MTSDCITVALTNAAATSALGTFLGQQLPAGSILLLLGDLGSGKTTLIQGLGQGLGIATTILSPTFTLINEYEEGRCPLYHLDLYRLQPEEVESLYLETYWEGKEVESGIVAIEWSERLPYKPDCYLQVQLQYAEDGGRMATLSSSQLSPSAAQLVTTFQQELRSQV